MSWRQATTMTALSVLLITGCGVPLSPSAEPLPLTTWSGSTTPSASASTATTASVIWLVDSEHLTPVDLVLPHAGGLPDLMAALAAPPNSGALRTLVSDPVDGSALASLTDPGTPSDDEAEPAQATVALNDHFAQLSAVDQVLLIGQVVLTVTDAGLGSVRFVGPTGDPLAVPLPDGRIHDGAVTRSDYVSLSQDA